MFRTLLVAAVVCASLAASSLVSAAHATKCVNCERPVKQLARETVDVARDATKLVLKTGKCAACVVKNRVVEPTLEAGAEVVRSAAKAVKEYSVRVKENRRERACQRDIKRECRRLECEARYRADDADGAKPFSGKVESGSYSATK